jgi:hypothetical protein
MLLALFLVVMMMMMLITGLIIRILLLMMMIVWDRIFVLDECGFDVESPLSPLCK